MEFAKGIIGKDERFGITTVEPNRALKKCKIRKLLIEYFQSDDSVAIVIPKSCGLCSRSDVCLDDFILQIIEKNSKPYDRDAYTALGF